MSTFPYTNPQSPNRVLGPSSTYLNRSFGTNFSTLSVGGYMEVFSLDQLYYTVPTNTYGQINYSGNSIPINFFKGSGTTFSFDTLTLNSDKISSGRRKLGMLVYVYEEKQLYQFIIDNYETLWNNALSSPGTVVVSNFGTTVRGNSPAGVAFISAWTSNNIQGVSGNTVSNSVWKKKNFNLDTYVTGGTISTIPSVGSNGGQINLFYSENIPPSTYFLPYTDTFITGFTYENNNLTLKDNSGNTFNVLIDYFTGLTINGDFNVTGTTNLNNLISNTISATSITSDSVSINGELTVNNLISLGQSNFNNITITGTGLYDIVATGSSLDEIVNYETLTSYTQTNDVYITGNTYTGATFDSNDEILGLLYHSTPLGGPYFLNSKDTFTTGGTFNIVDGKITFKRNDGLSGYTVDLSQIDIDGTYVTGGTLTLPNDSTNNGLINLEYNQFIPPFTYYLPYTDTFITGLTYSNNTFTIKDNSGNTFNTTINKVSGLTVNGDLTVTGQTILNNLTVTGTGLYNHVATGSSLDEIVNYETLTSYTQTNDVYVTGNTYVGATNSTNNVTVGLLYHSTPLGGPHVLNIKDTYTTGGTYDNSTALITFRRNDGSGYTVNLSTLDLNDTYVTGGTLTLPTNSTNSGSINLLYSQDVSSGTYFLPYTDTFITGFTYNNSNVFTIKDNSGNTFNANISVMSGLSINGNLNITGNTTQSGNFNLTGNTNQVGNINVTGNTNQVGDFNITGNTNQIGNFAITGNTTQLGNYTLTGNSTQFGVYTHSGNTFMTGNTSQVGNYNTTGNTTQYGNTYLSGTSLSGQCALFVDGNVCIDGDLTVTGDTSLIGDVCIKNANSNNTPTGTACLGTTLIPTSGTTYHEFQNKNGTLAHLGDLATGEPNSKGYIYMENNPSGTTLPSVPIGGQAQYQKISGLTTTISAYNNFFTTGNSSNELVYTYTGSTGGTLTYLKYNISYTASINNAQNKQITFQLFKNPYPYTGGTGTTVNGCSSCEPVPAAMTNYIQGNNAATGTLTGIVTAQYLDKFTLYAIHTTNTNVTTNLIVSDLTISLFT